MRCWKHIHETNVQFHQELLHKVTLITRDAHFEVQQVCFGHVSIL